MGDTKERILTTALELFAQKGYEAVSTGDIAEALGITKGALYRHYESKQAIFDAILARMAQRDGEQAQAHDLPEGTAETDKAAYEAATVSHIVSFSRDMFRYWTEDPFAAPFRRMLTLEQYATPEMGRLYQQYLAAGPMGYVADLFRGLGLTDPARRAAVFYGPMFLLYSVYDGAADKEAVTALLDETLENTAKNLLGEEK
ncbi:MAG: TetR/AcrR family transcriptional regulator [Clostridia bacterium]|nr:TetR/AcrR family transcriptional regulator [Clostridia bacterium]